MCRLGGGCRSGDRQAVAARHERNAKLPFDPVEVLIALTVEQRQKQVVVEFELGAPFGKLAGGGGRKRGHAATASVSEPDRLLALAAVISAGTISPIRSAGAARCTLWR